eukprot:g10420.t1
MYEALKSGYSSAESLVPEVSCQSQSKQDKLTISEEAMPRFLPPCAPRLVDFAKSTCALEGEGEEVLSMLSQPLKFISQKFVKRLAGLPGGMTRIGAEIIKGKLEGHDVYLKRARSRKGFGLKCIPQRPDEDALASALDTLQELEDEIKACWSHDLERVASLRKELLKRADLAPEDKGDGTLFWLGRRGGNEGHLWLEWIHPASMATHLAAAKELDSVREFKGCVAAVNKVVDTNAAMQVGRGILGLMLYVNRVAQAQLVLGCLQDLRGAVKRTQSKGIDEIACKDLQTLAGRVAMFLGCQRNYTTGDPEISPAFLLFEYVTGFMVRKQQVTLIRRFAEEAFNGRSLVAQMIMGAGKTTCIAPMLTLLLGNDGRLEDPFDVKLVKMQLFDAQRDAAVVCTTPAAIKSMFLRHLELLQLNHILASTMKKYEDQMYKASDSVSQTRIKKRMDDDINGNRVMAGFIGDVLGMLRNNSCALIDEVDLVLHPLKSELNFPIGSFEMYDLGCDRWHLAVHLLDALFLTDEGHAAAGIFYPDIRNCGGKASCRCYDLLTLQKQPHLVLLSRAWYDKNLLRPLADWLACWIITRPEAGKFRSGVEYNDVCEFLSMDLTDLLKSDVKSKVDEKTKADSKIGKLLTLGREWLFQLVPHVLSKVNRVQYGLLTERELALPENQKAPTSRRLLAVPFVAKDKPSPAAEFAQPDVLIGFTVLAYRYEGMRLSDTVTMLHHLQMKSGRESGPWSSRPTCEIGTKRYKEKGGKSSVGGLGPLNWEVKLDEWKKLPSNITELLREAEKMVQVNLKSKKEREIRQVEESAKRGEDLKLPELQALSSSTGDEESKKKKEKKDDAPAEGTAKREEEKPQGHAQVAVELLGPVPEIVLWYLLTMVFDAVLRQQPYKLSATGQELGSSMLFSSRIGFSGTPSSLLPEDLGECLFEAENEGEILSDGVAYFDDHDAPMVILRGAVKPALLSEAGVPMNRRFTFFDQVHTTGTDTKQPLQSYAALTLSASMTFRDYAQGAWRMRGLGKGQKLRMMIAPELAKKVAGVVKTDGELGLHDAVAFMLSNQFDSEGSELSFLSTAVQHALDDLMKEPEVKKRESKEMRDQVEAFLESLRFPVETNVHEPLTLDQKMQNMTDEQAHIMNEKEKGHCAKLINAALHVGREREREVEWPLKILQKESQPEESGVFYQLAKFQMSGLKCKLKCSGSALISTNHTANDLKTMNVRRMKSVLILLVVGPKTMAVSMAEAAALRRARHLASEHLPSSANLWICSGSKKLPDSSQNLFADGRVMIEPEGGVLKAHRLEAARCLLRFFNCDLDFRPEEVTSTVKALEAGANSKQRQHFRLVQNLYANMKDRFKSAGAFFKVLDVNGDGVIQHEEFQRSMKKVFKGVFSAEDVRKLFNAADSSGRGNVTSQDLRQLLESGAMAAGGVLANEGADADPADPRPSSPSSPSAPDEPEDIA